MIQIPDFVEELVLAGIQVTITKDSDQEIYFDLNLNAKSHMHLYKTADGYVVKMRYGEEYPVEDICDLKYHARQGMHGRDYINPAWGEFLMTDEQRAQRNLAKDALAKLTTEEQQALKKVWS
jgi:hypothetical protein